MSRITDWLGENKEKIEKAVEIIGKSSEVLASTVGQLHPVLEAVFTISAELLSNPEGREAKYLAEQFEKVNQKLKGIQTEIDQIAMDQMRASLNKQNFDYEVKINEQFNKFLEFVNAKPKFKELKKGKFVNYFEEAGSDVSLCALYNAVIGESVTGKPIMDTIVETEQRSRRGVEDFCVELKKLFVMGLVALMAYRGLVSGGAKDETAEKWLPRMEEVETRMKAAVDDCVENFDQQAQKDLKNLVAQNPAVVDEESLKPLLKFLEGKYDWISWSIRVIKQKESFFFFNWMAGKRYQGVGGSNSFEIPTDNKLVLVVSFADKKKLIDKDEIQRVIEQQKLKGNMEDQAQALKNSFPNYTVHMVSKFKTMAEVNNFPEESFYKGKHNNFLYIHPE